jgi:DinB superfamily
VRNRRELAHVVLDEAFQMLADNVRELRIDEALFVPAGGHRSTLGTLKHIAGWSHVYRSYAFDRPPKHWAQIDWPRGLRDTVDSTQSYLDEVMAWAEAAHQNWLRCLSELSEDEALDELRPMHWGELKPLFDIVATIARHHVYHAGEINQLLSIVRGEAWEEYEEVEENHISTAGHRVRPPWLSQSS